MKPTKVLILAYYFPPMGGVGVQRVIKLLKYFHVFDIQAHVVTTDNIMHSVMDYSLESENVSNDVVIHRLDCPPLAAYVNRRSKRCRLSAKDIWLFLRSIHTMDVYGTWWLSNKKTIRDLVREIAPDCIYTTAPPHSISALGYYLKRHSGIPWVAELRDSMTEWPLRRRGVVTHIQSRIESVYEKLVYRNADGIVFVTDGMKANAIRRCRNLIHQNCAVIYNGYDENADVSSEEHGSIKTDESQKDQENLSEVVVVYTGSLSNFKLDQTLAGFAIFRAYLSEKGVGLTLRIAGPVHDGLELSISKAKMEHCTELLGVVSHADSLELQRRADMLLILQTEDGSSTGSEILTGKVFEYHAARKPILAAVIRGDLSNYIQKNRIGVVANPNQSEDVFEAAKRIYKHILPDRKGESELNFETRPFTRLEVAENTSEFIKKIVNQR